MLYFRGRNKRVLGVLYKVILKFQFEEPFLRGYSTDRGKSLLGWECGWDVSMCGETLALQNQEYKGQHCKPNLCQGSHWNRWPTWMWWRDLIQGTWVTFLGFGVQISQRADGQLMCKEKELPCGLCCPPYNNRCTAKAGACWWWWGEPWEIPCKERGCKHFEVAQCLWLGWLSHMDVWMNWDC